MDDVVLPELQFSFGTMLVQVSMTQPKVALIISTSLQNGKPKYKFTLHCSLYHGQV